MHNGKLFLIAELGSSSMRATASYLYEGIVAVTFQLCVIDTMTLSNYFNFKGTYQWIKYTWTYCRKTGSRTPSCTKPWEPTIYVLSGIRNWDLTVTAGLMENLFFLQIYSLSLILLILIMHNLKTVFVQLLLKTPCIKTPNFDFEISI